MRHYLLANIDYWNQNKIKRDIKRKPGEVQLNLAVPEATRRGLKIMAAQEGSTIQKIGLKALLELLNRGDTKAKTADGQISSSQANEAAIQVTDPDNAPSKKSRRRRGV